MGFNTNAAAAERAKPSSKVVILIVLAVLCLVMLFISIVNIIGAIGLAAPIRAQEDLLLASNARIEQLLRLAESEAETRRTLESYRIMLPEGVSQNEVFTNVQSLSEKYGVSVSQIGFDAVQPSDNLQALPLDISLNGPYPSVMAMLEELTVEGRLTRLEKLSLSSSSDDRKSVEAQAHALLFFQDDAGKVKEGTQ